MAEIAAIEVISRAKKAVAKATIEAENASEMANNYDWMIGRLELVYVDQ